VSKAQEMMKLEIEGMSGISLCPQWACAKRPPLPLICPQDSAFSQGPWAGGKPF